jgi:Ser/Thr protein kinase RdoA (MazF antagonist)
VSGQLTNSGTTHFPVTNSNLSAKHLEIFLRDKYSFSKNIKCRLIRAGINDTYLITDNADQFVFRVYSLNWRTKVEIEEEIRLLNLLHQQNISVSYPIPDSKENYIQTLNAPEGNRFGLMFSYAKGQKLHNFPADVHYSIGALMARLHVATNNLSLERVHYTPQVLLVDPLVQLEKFLPSDSEEMQFMKRTQQQFLNEFKNINLKEIRTGIVHMDIWFDNLNISEQNEITLFDFDFCGNGWLCLDFAYYILQVHNVERNEEECKLKVDRFIEGYESITKISNEEKKLIPLLGVTMHFFYLGIQCQRFENWSNSFLNETYLKRFINALVKRYYDIHKMGEPTT